MPAVLASTMLGTAIAGGAAAGATIYGSKKQTQSAKRAQDIQSTSDAAAIEEARLEREEAKRQFDISEANRQREIAAAEEERAYNRRLQEEREARQAPYRAASAAALGNLGKMLGIDLSQQQSAMLAPRMPRDGAPGMPTSPSAAPAWQEAADRGSRPRGPNGEPLPLDVERIPMTLGEQVRLAPQRRLA